MTVSCVNVWCRGRGDDGEPRPSRQVAPPHRLCGTCCDRLEETLGRLGDAYEDLAASLARRGGRAERVSGTPEKQLPIDVAVSDQRAEVRARLVSWCLLVAEERGVSHPRDDVRFMTAWLARQLPWLRCHEAVGECYTELRETLARSVAMVDVPATRTSFVVGPCPEIVNDGGQVERCPGEVRAFVPADETRPSRMECGCCGAVWESHQWLRAGRRILDERDRRAS